MTIGYNLNESNQQGNEEGREDGHLLDVTADTADHLLGAVAVPVLDTRKQTTLYLALK